MMRSHRRDSERWVKLMALTAALLVFGTLLSNSVCALAICSAPNSEGSRDCSGMDTPKFTLSVVAGSAPACCALTRLPPSRTEQNTFNQSVGKNVLPLDTTSAIAVSCGAPRVFAGSAALSPPGDAQSVLSVFLI